jgi:hypothetical protein
MVAAPHEQTGNIEAVIGVQMRKQNAHVTRIDITLQRPEDAGPEIENDRRGLLFFQEVTRRG